jgi:hypothetical protein
VVEPVSNDVPTEARAVEGTRHCSEADGTARPPAESGPHMAVASPKAAAEASAVASTMASAAPTASGESLTWNDDEKRTRDREDNKPIHASLLN